MSTVFRCLQCSHGTFGDRRPPWPKCFCGGKWEIMTHFGAHDGIAPAGVAQGETHGRPFYHWLRSWHGDFGWDEDTMYLVRMPPPDQATPVDFFTVKGTSKWAKVGMAVNCPRCHAKPWVQCTRPSEHQAPFKDMHRERKDKADAILFWQYGADAQITMDAEGKAMVVPGIDRDEELKRFLEHRAAGMEVARKKKLRLPAVPRYDPSDLASIEPAPRDEVAAQLSMF